MEVLHDRLLHNNELYLQQCGGYIDSVLKGGEVHIDSLTIEDRQAYELYKNRAEKLSHCDRDYVSPSSRARHIRDVSFPCCYKTFAQRNGRDKHLNSCSDVYVFPSCIRGKHVYTFWEPVFNMELACQPEDGNKCDEYAVSVIINNRIAGHVPRSVSRIFSTFLQAGGAIVATITGETVDHGCGLEVPVDYIFTGSKTSIRAVKESLNCIP